MKVEIQISLEEAVMLLAAYIATLLLGYSWGLFFALILLPDLSMFGYLFNNRIGAASYNFFHSRALAVVLTLTGVVLKLDWLVLSGIVLFGHISMDRHLGYGLKYNEGFHSTHLGKIGQKRG